MARFLLLKYGLPAILLVSGTLQSQDIDSLLRAATAKPDIAIIDQLYNTGFEYEGYAPETAKRIYYTAGELSRKLNYPEGYCRFAANYTAVLNMQGKYDSSLIINQDALEVALNTGDEVWINKTRFNIGNCYNNKNLFETALSYYIQVLPYFEKSGNTQHLAQIYDVLQILYRNMGQYEKSVYYGEKAVALLSDNPESLIAGYIQMHLAINRLKIIPPRKQIAFEGLAKSLAIAKANNDMKLESATLINFGDYYYKEHRFTEAEKYYRMALPVCEKIGNHEGVSIIMRSFSYCELYKKNYKESYRYLSRALSIANQYDFTDEKRECYKLFAELSLIQYDFPLYFHYTFQHDSIVSSIQNDMILRNTQDLEIKYETEKKEIKIAAMQQEKTFYSLISISGFLASLFFISVLFYRQKTIRTKKELAEQKIIQLEQEKQLIATQAVLEGETTERSRLARDLHDGLGGLLTSMKLSLHTMKERVFLDENGRKMFVNALDLLDMSVKELHQVAHNMMPESLLNCGLKTAVDNFVKNIEAKENSNLSFRFFGTETRYMPDFEMAVYRMVQELYNNALKHAQAAEIFLQMVIDDNRLNISYEDNGKGFETKCLEMIGKGMGLNNIMTRVKAFGGQIDISSNPGQGTQVTIEFDNTNKFLLLHDTGSDC